MLFICLIAVVLFGILVKVIECYMLLCKAINQYHSMVLLFTSTGLKTIEGYLLSKGIRVQRSRLTNAVMRADPIGGRLRAMNTIRRRVYQVRSPLALWHMDGNHKLIR